MRIGATIAARLTGVARVAGLTAPSAVRRIEQAGELFVGKPDDRLQFQRVQVADAPRAQVLQAQPRRVTVGVES